MLKSNFFLFPLIGYRKIADCIASVSHFLHIVMQNMLSMESIPDRVRHSLAAWKFIFPDL
ncbi:MAG: hypothetical protein A2X81_20040 [Desulfobacterales bacterium GWB2_56_26]|nr:MAG: hypothetical protein A2X81_20040 [Desulfobacterales bacterium GWB2_56_26]